MQDTGIPAKFGIAWGASAGGSYIRSIPTTSQIGINNGYASYPDGFVPLNALPTTSGGVPPFIQDFNGIFNAITLWSQWLQAGGAVPFDSSFSSSIGGYPKGAIVPSSTTFGQYWLCLADNNTSNPDSGGSNWQGFRPGAAGNFYWADTGAANVLAITPQPAYSAYANGLFVLVNPAFNNTGACTIALNGLSAIPIINSGTGTALTSGEVVAGQVMELVYLNGSFQYLNAPQGITACTAADIWAGSDGSRYLNSAAVKNAMVPQTLTSASTISWNLNNGMNAYIPLLTNATMGVPTNLQRGATMALAINQSSISTPNTMSWNACFDFGATGVPTLTARLTATDYVWMYVHDAVAPVIKCSFWKSA